MTQPLRLRLLGPPSIHLGDEDLTALFPDRTIALLASVALASGLAIRREDLLERLWGSSIDAQVQSNLRTILTRLRKRLPGHLVVERSNVAFAADAPRWIDAQDLGAWARSAETLPPDSAARQRERALRLVRGDFLEGLVVDDAPELAEWLHEWRERTTSRVRRQRLKLARGWLALGRPELARTVARDALRTDPLDEAAVHELMAAYAELGDAGRARREFEEFGARLKDELGLAPGRAIRELAARLDRGDLPKRGSKRRPRHPARNLPTPATSFHGREAEVRYLRDLLLDRSHRLVTIHGASGIGKTRLALEAARSVADDFAHGVLFVELGAAGDDANEGDRSVRTAISRAVRLYPAGDPDLEPWLAERDLLVVLDRAEAAPGTTEFVRGLLQQAPLVTFLATSLEPLGTPAETILHLDGLDPDAAAALLRERTRDWTGEDLPADDDGGIGAICELVGGSPLGVEIAASNAGTMTLPAIARELREDPRRLESDRVDLAPRHRNVAGLFDAAWHRLGERERTILTGLALFEGPFDEPTAEEATGAKPTDLLRLGRASLVQPHGAGLFALHPVVASLLAARPDAQPHERAPREEHWAREILAGFARRGRPCDLPAWYRDVLESAARRTAAPEGIAVLGQVAERLVRALGPRAIPVLERGLALAGEPVLRRRLSGSLAAAMRDAGRTRDAAECLHRELEAAEPGAEHPVTLAAQVRLAALLRQLGNTNAALALATTVEGRARRAGVQAAAVGALLVRMESAPGSVEDAEEALRAASELKLYRERVGFLRILYRLQQYRDPDAARTRLEHARELAEGVGDRLSAIELAAELGALERLHGCFEPAAERYRELLDEAELLPAPDLALRLRLHLADALHGHAPEEAEEQAQKTVRLATRAGATGVAASARALLAGIHLRLGELERAMEGLRACVAAGPDGCENGAPRIETLIDAVECAALLERDASGFAAALEQAVQRSDVSPYQSARAWLALGRHRSRSGAPERARAAFERAGNGVGPGRAEGLLELALDDIARADPAAAAARLESLDDRERRGWLCYRVLRAIEHPSALIVLRDAVRAVREEADRIRDPYRRASFLRRTGEASRVLPEWERTTDRPE